ARAHGDARRESEGEGEQQRNLRRLAVDLATVALETALEEVLAVVRGDDEERVLEVALVGEELEEGFDEAVDPADRVVVAVRVARAEARRFLVVEVLVEVHQGQVEETAPPSLGAQEPRRRLEGSLA